MKQSIRFEIKSAAAAFQTKGAAKEVMPYGNGHINETYLVRTELGEDYILQRLNTTVFPHPEEVMANIRAVTAHISEKLLARGGDPERETLVLIPTKDGKWFYKDGLGGFFRMYRFVPDSLTLESATSDEIFGKAGEAFGNFMQALADFPAESLFEVIPRFHDTPKRYGDFCRAVEADIAGRVSQVPEEIAFFRENESFYSVLQEAHAKGDLPLRVTHNDTKLNNILFDKEGKEPICVIDLDTVMPGFSVTDFGDAIRFGASTAPEDEKDLSLVHFSLSRYRAYVDGFFRGGGSTLPQGETELLPEGAIMMTLECGMRFLTDYLQGDTYFKIHRKDHNLDRCRTQIQLAKEMLAALPKMKEIGKEFQK